MILKIYTVKDKLTGFTGPICFKDDKVAERWFEAYCKQKKEAEYTEPKYYELYDLGTYDTDTGVISGKLAKDITLIREGETYESE